MPQKMAREFGPAGWNLFRKLVEIELETNLVPGWAGAVVQDLADWTGSDLPTVQRLLEQLVTGKYLELRDHPFLVSFRIQEPLRVSLSEAEIRERLSRRCAVPPGIYLRYLTPLDAEDKIQRVVHLYQCCFGISFTPKAAEDLEQIAVSYDMGTILETFEEAYHLKSKGLSWIKKRLAGKTQST
ncbi:MAG TPA: hypothetical protein PLZ55_02160 [bacterium]|nr:hypothetical protein [bacterium]HPO07444.1 hypothetical protein [bacterium]HQO36686.1 hypothetical protein [bacterium]HQQ01046.1 hypothetical protein [bacterium]